MSLLNNAQRRLASHKMYEPKEAHTLIQMLKSEGSRELALNIVNTSKKRFFENERRTLHKELNLLKSTLGQPAWRWGYQSSQLQMWGTRNPGAGYSQIYDDSERELLEEIQKAQWKHSKKSYTVQEWEKTHWKKEYRRSAKNHYS